MHWHHIDPDYKSFNVSNAPTVEDAMAEIAKCELLCSRCHARHHAIERHRARQMCATHPLNQPKPA